MLWLRITIRSVSGCAHGDVYAHSHSRAQASMLGNAQKSKGACLWLYAVNRAAGEGRGLLLALFINGGDEMEELDPARGRKKPLQ